MPDRRESASGRRTLDVALVVAVGNVVLGVGLVAGDEPTLAAYGLLGWVSVVTVLLIFNTPFARPEDGGRTRGDARHGGDSDEEY